MKPMSPLMAMSSTTSPQPLAVAFSTVYLYYPLLYFSHLFSSVVYGRNPLLYMVFGLVNLGIEYFVGCMDLVILIWICKMELISKGFGCTVYMCLNQ